MTTTTGSALLPTDWIPGVTRVRLDHGSGSRIGTFVGDCTGAAPGSRRCVLVRFLGDEDPVDVDLTGLTVVSPNLFAGVTVPTRYAPGAHPQPYHQYRTRDDSRWVPVIYYPAGEVEASEGPIWLVEPYPATRADGTDGCDPVDVAGVTVVRGAARPRPRGDDPDDDWIIPERSHLEDVAYEVFVTDDKTLMGAWCEAHAIAAALNNGTVAKLGVRPEDVNVLVAAARGELVAEPDSFRYLDGFRYTLGDTGNPTAVPPVQVHRLLVGSYNLIEPVTVATGGSQAPARYGLSRRGATVLGFIRASYDGPRRCRACGCTDERGCPPDLAPGGCSWWGSTGLCTVCR